MIIFKLPQFAEKIADKRWNSVLVWLLRVVIGAVFIYSGFTKAVDPWGGAYKWTEYCAAYGLESMQGAALGLSFALSALEFMLGVFVLTGCFRRGTPALLLCMMAVLLPITLDLAITNRVAHCGCFGDAVVVSNWMSFLKNVAITLALVYLIAFNRRVHGVYGPAVNWVVGLLAFIFIACVGYNGYFWQPLVDYLQYQVGDEIGASADVDADACDYEFVYEKDGERQAFDVSSLPDEEQGWTFVERRFKEGKQPKAQAETQPISLFDDGVDVTEDVLPNTGDVLLLLFPDLRGVNISYSFTINELYARAVEQGMSVVAATPASPQDVAWWRDISMAAYDIYTIDDTELKSIARGNPAVVLVSEGKIAWKRTLASLSEDRVEDEKTVVAQLNDDYDRSEVLSLLVWQLVLALVALLIFNRTHVLVKYCHRKSKKSSNFAE